MLDLTKDDYRDQIDKTTIDIARYRRLVMDFEKEEGNRIQEFVEAFKNSISSYGVEIKEGISKKVLKVKSPEQEVGNLVSNTGVVANDTTGIGTARRLLAASGYSTS